MSIDLILDSLDGVNESLKAVYTERDGKFQLDPDKYADAQAQGLKKKNGELLGKLNTASAAAKKAEKFKALFEAEDDEVEQFLEQWTKRGEGSGKPDPDSDAAKQIDVLKKQHAKDLKKREDEMAALKTNLGEREIALREFQLWTPLRELAIKAGLNADDWELARLDLANQKRFDFDDDGKITVLEDGVASSVSPERFFKEVYSEQRPKLYKATGAGGSGASAGNGKRDNSKTIKRAAFDQLLAHEKMEKIKAGFKVVD